MYLNWVSDLATVLLVEPVCQVSWAPAELSEAASPGQPASRAVRAVDTGAHKEPGHRPVGFTYTERRTRSQPAGHGATEARGAEQQIGYRIASD